MKVLVAALFIFIAGVFISVFVANSLNISHSLVVAGLASLGGVFLGYWIREGLGEVDERIEELESKIDNFETEIEKTQIQTQYLEDYLGDIQTQIINVVDNTQSLNR